METTRRSWREKVTIASQRSRSVLVIFALWAAVSVLLSIVLLDASSRSLEDEAPGIALRLNPFNADARVASITQALNAPTAPDLEQLAQEASDGIRFDRVDARFRSLLGEIWLRKGNPDL